MAINHVFWTVTTTSTSKVTFQVSYPSFILLICNHLQTWQIAIWSYQYCLSPPPLDTSITAQSKTNAWWSGTCHIMHRGDCSLLVTTTILNFPMTLASSTRSEGWQGQRVEQPTKLYSIHPHIPHNLNLSQPTLTQQDVGTIAINATIIITSIF